MNLEVSGLVGGDVEGLDAGNQDEHGPEHFASFLGFLQHASFMIFHSELLFEVLEFQYIIIISITTQYSILRISLK